MWNDYEAIHKYNSWWYVKGIGMMALKDFLDNRHYWGSPNTANMMQIRMGIYKNTSINVRDEYQSLIILDEFEHEDDDDLC